MLNCAAMEGMVDWLDEVRKAGGEWAWIWKRRPFLEQWQSRTQLLSHEEVLRASRVKEAVSAASRRKVSEKEVVGEAEAILSQMAHQFHMGYVRPIGYSVMKAIMRLYPSIFVNLVQLERVKAAAYQSGGDPIPVVFLPTHRSYLDFLLISLICYHVECPLPAIAAGEDFLTSKFLGESLRRCGAFFLRRQFGNDPLYRALFSEYVRLLLTRQHGRPLEFFVEGQRSRTLKGLPPKTGLLQLAVEPFLRAEVYDILFVPISIDYDKILEESLYVHELLGSPKPKETTSGLFKARQILQQSYGNVYVRFGGAISLREYFLSAGVDPRREYVLMPKDEFAISPRHRRKILSLANRIVDEHSANKTLTMWPLICACIIQIWPETARKSEGFHHPNMMGEVRSLAKLCEKLGISIRLLGTSTEQDISYFFALHSGLVKYEEGLVEFPSPSASPVNGDEVLPSQSLVTYITLLHYSNPLLASLAPHALAAVAIVASGGLTRVTVEAVEKGWSLLRTMFDNEFVMPPFSSSSLPSTLASIEYAGFLRDTPGDGKQIRVTDTASVLQLARLLLPYLASYCELMKAIGVIRGPPTSDSATPTAEKIGFFRTEVNKRLSERAVGALPSLARGHATAAASSELIKNVYRAIIANDYPIENTVEKLERVIGAVIAETGSARSKL